VGKVSLLSIGCPKNLVDSEKLLSKLKEKGISYVSNPVESDILIINTCGFTRALRKRVEEILKLSKLKGDIKSCCIPAVWQKICRGTKREIPEIDASGVGDMRSSSTAVKSYLSLRQTILRNLQKHPMHI
jgi:ribosomal protein S12 methylthiotransferase